MLIWPNPEKLKRKRSSKLEHQVASGRLAEARAIVGWSWAQAEEAGLVQSQGGARQKGKSSLIANPREHFAKLFED